MARVIKIVKHNPNIGKSAPKTPIIKPEPSKGVPYRAGAEYFNNKNNK